MRRVMLRADGSAEIGLGHVFRLLAMAEMLREENFVIFAICKPSKYLREQILQAVHELIDLPETSSYLEEAGYLSNEFLEGTVLILDGYKFDTAYQAIVKQKAKAVVCIDDIFACHFVADAVVNHSEGILKSLYTGEPYTKFYLGFNYALVRKPFLDLAKRKKDVNSNNAVFISLGGADKDNCLLTLIQQCEGKGGLYEYHVVMGSAYSFKRELESYLINSGLNIRLYHNLDAGSIATLMNTCSMGICSPSTVCMEYLCTGGQLYLYQIADNQEAPYRAFISKNIAKPFELFGETIIEKKASRRFIDGKSDERYREMLSSFFSN